MDQAITQWINAFAGRDPVLDAFAIATTNFGVPLLVALVVAQWWSSADWRQSLQPMWSAIRTPPMSRSTIRR